MRYVTSPILLHLNALATEPPISAGPKHDGPPPDGGPVLKSLRVVSSPHCSSVYQKHCHPAGIPNAAVLCKLSTSLSLHLELCPSPWASGHHVQKSLLDELGVQTVADGSILVWNSVVGVVDCTYEDPVHRSSRTTR